MIPLKQTRERSFNRSFADQRSAVAVAEPSQRFVSRATHSALSGGASVLAWVLARQVFDLPHSPDPWIWLFGLGGGVGLVLTAGWLATRDLLDEPPLKALRMD